MTSETMYERIYALRLPGEREIRYVGRTEHRLRERLAEHWKAARGPRGRGVEYMPVHRWMRMLKVPPEIVLLAKVPAEHAAAVEAYLIKKYSSPLLLNHNHNPNRRLTMRGRRGSVGEFGLGRRR